jgi:hypothetical protein
MLEKDPLAYSLFTYIFVFSLSTLGGISSYIGKCKGNLVSRFSLVELIGEIVISAFVGVITFYLCEAAELNKIFSAALVGISSHMGSRTIMILEDRFSATISKWLKLN